MQEKREGVPRLEENEVVLGFGGRTAQMILRVAGRNTKLTSHLDDAEAIEISRLNDASLYLGCSPSLPQVSVRPPRFHPGHR